jgi:two-component system sensor histidine kinase HydH
MIVRKFTAIFIVVLILFITYLHYSSAPAVQTLHNIYRELYYLPVLLGALAYGLAGALLSYSLVFILYLPYVIMTWPGSILSETNRLLPLLMQCLFAFIAGYLVDRERQQRIRSERDRYLADIGRIATVIVHDLKNPLIAISGFAKRMKDGKGNTDKALEVIIDSAAQMEKTVVSVLDFARPLSLELKRMDIRENVKRAGDVCRIKAEQKNVVLSLDLPQEPVKRSIDSFHFERALVNLIANAIEASGGGQRVSVIMTAHKKKVTITITDNGPGMDAETLESAFIPFYTKKRGGTGLGVPIAKKIIEGHQGNIRIDSKKGEGTVVMVELPYDAKTGSFEEEWRGER